MDVKTAFLNGVIEEEVYIEQPEKFDVENRETMYADYIKLFTGSSRHLEHGTQGLTAIYGRWNFSGVRLTTTCTS